MSTVATSPRFVSNARAPAAAPQPHGLPQDLWLIDLGSGAVQKLAALKDDAAAIDWDREGKHIYVLATNGFYEVDVEAATFARMGDGFLHGALVWVKKG